MRMRLTWQDSAATLLTGLVVVGYALFIAGVELPLIASVRGVEAAGFVGAVALFAAVTALITASGVALAVLVSATVVLWVLATLRHAFTPPRARTGSTDPLAMSRRHHAVGS